jgi:hypothetical protein
MNLMTCALNKNIVNIELIYVQLLHLSEAQSTAIIIVRSEEEEYTMVE